MEHPVGVEERPKGRGVMARVEVSCLGAHSGPGRTLQCQVLWGRQGPDLLVTPGLSPLQVTLLLPVAPERVSES